MTVEAGPAAEIARKRRKFILSMLGGAVFGGAVGSGTVLVVDDGWLGEPNLSQVIALLVALIYVLMGLIVGLGAMSPALGAKFLNVEDADELHEEKQLLLTAGWGMVALGMMLAVVALGGDGRLLTTMQALIAALILGVAAIALSWRSFWLADELMRATMNEGAVFSYYLLFVGIGGWALLSQLGLVPPPAMLDILTAFWAAGLLASFWAAGKRGMLVPR